METRLGMGTRVGMGTGMGMQLGTDRPPPSTARPRPTTRHHGTTNWDRFTSEGWLRCSLRQLEVEHRLFFFLRLLAYLLRKLLADRCVSLDTGSLDWSTLVGARVMSLPLLIG